MMMAASDAGGPRPVPSRLWLARSLPLLYGRSDLQLPTVGRRRLAPVDVPLPVFIAIRADQPHSDLFEHARRRGVRGPDGRVDVNVMAP